jgi:tetratricopeptide (TPR) repeat protein
LWRASDLPTAKQLLACDNVFRLSPRDANAFYAGAWIMVYVIARDFQPQLGRALGRMVAGERPTQALAEGFGPAGLAELEEKYRAQVRVGLATTRHWRVQYQPPPVGGVEGVEELDDREVHLLWASLEPTLAKGYMAQIDLAEAHEGVSPRSRFMRGMNHAARDQLTPAERDFAAAVVMRPNEERYRWALAQLHFDDALERRFTDEQLDKLEPEMRWLVDNARSRDSLILIAHYQARRNRLADARASVMGALDIDRASVGGWDLLSAIALAQGDIDGALDAGERALHLAPDGKDMTPTLERLDKVRALRRLREQRTKAPD